MPLRQNQLPIIRAEARKRASEECKRVEQSAGDPRGSKSLIRFYLGHPDVLIDAAYRTIGGTEEPPWEAVLRLAEQINLFAPFTVPVPWWREPKKTAGYRIITSPPLALHAANLIVKDVLQVVYRPGAHVYDIQGRGRDLEANRIKEALEQGYRYVFLGDIRDAFPSVRVEALYSLPLPRSVTQHVLDYRFMQYTHDTPKEDPRFSSEDPSLLRDSVLGRQGPRGLLQGSPSSNLILAWLLNDMPSVLSGDLRLFVLTDNVLVMARTEEECRAAEQAIALYLERHPAGPFVLGQRERRHLDPNVMGERSFERAGYEFEVLPAYRPGSERVEISLSGENMSDLGAALIQAIEIDANRGRPYPVEGVRVLDAKLSGFRAITNLREFWRMHMNEMCDQLAHPLARWQGY